LKQKVLGILNDASPKEFTKCSKDISAWISKQEDIDSWIKNVLQKLLATKPIQKIAAARTSPPRRPIQDHGRRL
jgi:hypothetical protein